MFVTLFEEVERGSSVTRLKLVTLDSFPFWADYIYAENARAQCYSFKLQSFPSVDEPDTTFPQPTQTPVGPYTAAKCICTRGNCCTKCTYWRVIAAGIHEAFSSFRRWFSNNCIQVIKVQHKFSLELKFNLSAVFSSEQYSKQGCACVCWWGGSKQVHFHLQFIYIPLTLMDLSLSAFGQHQREPLASR